MRILKASAIVVAIAASFYLFASVSYDDNLLLKIISTEEPDITETSELMASEIVRIGNLERINHDVEPLILNERLSTAADMKIDDMLENQYFDHISPSGDEAGDLVESTEYAFIAVGENLATGDFKDEEDLVSGWMDSPGHRENILNPGYLEIGVAVRKGVYDGREVWMAVQIFALPDHACPKPDRNLFATISSNEERLSSIREDLEEFRKEIESTIPRDRDKVLEYNEMVYEYNSLSDETQEMAGNYNLQVESTNECISSYGF